MATEVKQRNNRMLIYVGALLALAAAGALLFLAQRNSGSSSSSGGPTVKTVYAAATIPKGTKITADMLALKDVSPDTAVGAATDPQAVINKFASITIAQGTQVQTAFLFNDANSAAAQSLAITPLDIPAGHVAMAIPTAWPGDAFRSADFFSISGLIQADDHIDMLVDPKGDGTVRYGFQDVHVLRVGGAAAPAAGAAPAATSVLIIEVPRAQAEQIAFVFEGKTPSTVVRYVLRPRSQYGKGYLGIDDSGGTPNLPQPADQPVTPDQFTKLFPTR